MGNYRAFIAAADALLAIREEVSSIDKYLESLVFISNFHKSCSKELCGLFTYAFFFLVFIMPNCRVVKT